MEAYTKEKQLEGVRGWWNSEQILKWDWNYDNYDIHAMRYLNSRQKKILEFVDGLKLKKSAKVLELGYGAGQTVLKLGQRSFEVYGVDISEKLCEKAKYRCRKGCPEGKFHLSTGSMESRLDFEDETFDLVITAGTFQYLHNRHICLKEIMRVLKPRGYFIIGTRNAYCMSYFTSFRALFRLSIYFFLREKYELFPSFKSMLIDSKLGVMFKRFENSKLFNSKFMLKGHVYWKYKLKKRLHSYFSTKKLLKKIGFSPLKSDGSYFCISEKPKYFNLNLKIDDFLQRLNNKGATHFLFPLARTIVIVSQKKEK